MSDKVQQVIEVAAHAPGLKAAGGTTILGAGTTAVSAAPDWVAYAGLVLTAVGLVVSIGMMLIGYFNLKEKRRENDLKERQLDLHEGT